MNRVLKILSVAVIAFLAYMWVSILYKSCNKNSEFENMEETSLNNDEEVPSIPDEYKEEPFFADDGESTSSNSGDTSEDPIDYNEIDKKIEETQKEERPSTVGTSSNINNNSGTSSGKYMVIAGSYIVEGNANTMVTKLRKLGYDNAEKVIFDLSQFHSVCAGRYDDYTKAVQASSELKRRGIDNYVHTRK